MDPSVQNAEYKKESRMNTLSKLSGVEELVSVRIYVYIYITFATGFCETSKSPYGIHIRQEFKSLRIRCVFSSISKIGATLTEMPLPINSAGPV